MEILRFLEGLRTPFLNSLFSFITQFGEETVFVVIAVIVFWCVDKKQGYFLMTVGFFGTVINQFLKLIFRIPRPWVKDENFTIVESARAEATGYSFPSGHAQSSVGVFGAIARWNKRPVLRIICIALCVLVPFSRLYLGVHTPLDVAVSVGIALLLIFLIYPIIAKCFENKTLMRIMFSVMVISSAALLIFATFGNFPKDTTPENIESGITNASKMLGCTLAIFLTYETDIRFTRFETSASPLGQILKITLGLLILIGIKSGLKQPLYMLFDSDFLADGIRYFIIVLFAGVLWPLTFKWFSKIGKKA